MSKVYSRTIFSVLFIATFLTQTVIAATIARHTVSGCKAHFASAEANHGLPSKLLEAIATVESGVKPWVINYNRRARFFHTKEAAAAEIRRLQKQGIRSINIGVMQLHAPSHQRRFKSIEDMLEPEKNIAYAADLLKRLHRRYGSIEQAVKYYHSASPIYNGRYKAKIYRIWNKLQGIQGTSSLPTATLSKYAPRSASAQIKPTSLVIEKATTESSNISK